MTRTLRWILAVAALSLFGPGLGRRRGRTARRTDRRGAFNNAAMYETGFAAVLTIGLGLGSSDPGGLAGEASLRSCSHWPALPLASTWPFAGLPPTPFPTSCTTSR